MIFWCIIMVCIIWQLDWWTDSEWDKRPLFSWKQCMTTQQNYIIPRSHLFPRPLPPISALFCNLSIWFPILGRRWPPQCCNLCRSNLTWHALCNRTGMLQTGRASSSEAIYHCCFPPTRHMSGQIKLNITYCKPSNIRERSIFATFASKLSHEYKTLRTCLLEVFYTYIRYKSRSLTNI